MMESWSRGVAVPKSSEEFGGGQGVRGTCRKGTYKAMERSESENESESQRQSERIE